MNELDQKAQKIRADLAELRAQLKAINAERTKLQEQGALAADLAKLKGKYSPQMLSAAGIESAEAIGTAGA